MNISIHTISTTVDNPICMSLEDIRMAMNEVEELQMLKTSIIRGWLHTKGEVKSGVERYWPIIHELVMIDGVAVKVK